MPIEKNLLEIMNPWWKEREVSSELAPAYKRKVFDEILNLSKKRQITVITGLRRVGKSTLMYQIIKEWLHKIRPENILYFSFDEKIENPTEILQEYGNLTQVDWKKEKCIIFFDEIQKLQDWSSKLKIIYDGFPNLKIIVSGSSSFQLEKEAKVNLAGRHFAVEVWPLSFAEYLELKKSKIDIKKPKLWENEITREFESYLLSPFPEIVNYRELNIIKSYIKGNVVEKILKIDLSDKFKELNEELLLNLIELFYDAPGTYLNLDELSNDLKVGKSNLIQHLYYLEFARLIRRVKNFRVSSRTTSRKLQRIYPFHWSLQFGWKGKISYESVVASMLDCSYYWREGKREVDFIVRRDDKTLPIEVKESKDMGKNDIANLVFFMEKFKIEKSFLVYNGEEGEIKIKGNTIKRLPFWHLSLYPDCF